jgi:hypothetical protein
MQVYLSFQLLGPPRAIDQSDEDGAIRCFRADAIQFEEVKKSQSEGGSFKLKLRANLKVSMMVMRWTGTSGWHPCQLRVIDINEKVICLFLEKSC